MCDVACFKSSRLSFARSNELMHWVSVVTHLSVRAVLLAYELGLAVFERVDHARRHRHDAFEYEFNE